MEKQPIVFNYRPDVALKLIDVIVETNAKDDGCTESQRKAYEDLQKLAHLGAQCLTSGPADPGNVKNS